jgi:glutamate formiminotransferase
VLALVRAKREVIDLMDRHGVSTRVGAERIYPTLPVAVAAYEQWAKEN